MTRIFVKKATSLSKIRAHKTLGRANKTHREARLSKECLRREQED